MSKLYPPSIEGKLPAFAGDSLKIPLTMNRAVSMIQVTGMRALVKTVQTGTIKATLEGSLSFEQNTGRYYAVFELGTNGFAPTLGQYYKVQVAYVDRNHQVGYYSSVGIIKFTSYPNLRIPDLENNFYGKYDYVAIYSQDNDTETFKDADGKEYTVVTLQRDGTEKIYSYCFELTDTNGNIVDTTGVKVHDSSTDMSTTQSSDSWTLRRNLTKNVPYYLTYKVTTLNGLEWSSPRYTIMDQDSVDADIPAKLIAELHPDDGYIGLYFQPYKESKGDIIINGSFVLARASSLDNFSSWDEVHRFSYSNVNLSNVNKYTLWEDYTIQQGAEYIYSLQAYNSFGLYSNKILNIDNIQDQNEISVLADFEDAFLYDGERQLKIRFNPKVTSFKNTVLESKMDTIGSQFPYVFRNGKVSYKEFPISGLISMLSDPNEKFLKGIQSANLFPIRQGTPSSDNPGGLDTLLNANNIHRERIFKMEVLKWLTNGKPKLFRSPTEGNFIVRLMNISMTPNDTLGRMLHTFSCTAYEIAENTFDNLVKLNLITLPTSNTTTLKIGQISPAVMLQDDERVNNYPDMTVQGKTIILPAAYEANITEATPGTVIGLNFQDGQGVVSVEIGGTGTYYIQKQERPLISISLISGQWDDAKLTFAYYDDTPANSFNQIVDLKLKDEIRQFIGIGFEKNIITDSNIMLGDIKREVGHFHYIKIIKRQIENLWRINGVYHFNEYGNDPLEEWNATVIYYVVNEDRYIDGKTQTVMPLPDFRFALNPKDDKDFSDFSGRENIDGKEQFGDTFGRMESLYNVEKVTGLYVGTGLLVDVAYRIREKEYAIETTDSRVSEIKGIYEKSMQDVDRIIKNPNATQKDFEKAVQQAQKDYKDFINLLRNELR